MKLLTFAHKKEAQAFLSSYTFKKGKSPIQSLYHCSQFYLLITGEGLNANHERLNMTLLKIRNEIDEVINLGVAGSVSLNLFVYDLVWIQKVHLWQNNQLNSKTFTSASNEALHDCISSPHVVFDFNQKKQLAMTASVVDCELWATANLCFEFKLPFQSLKVISDDLHSNNADLKSSIIKDSKQFSEKLFNEYQKRFPAIR